MRPCPVLAFRQRTRRINMDIKTKITTYNAILGGFILLGGIFVGYQTLQAEKSVEQVTGSNLPAMTHLGLMNDALKVHRIRTATHIMADTEDDKTFNAGRVAKQIVQFNENIAGFAALPNLNQKESVAKVSALWDSYVKSGEAVLAASSQNDQKLAQELFMATSLKLYSEISDVIDETMEAQAEAGRQAGADAVAAGMELMIGGGAALLFVLLAFAGTSYAISRALTASLLKLGSSYNHRKTEISTSTKQASESVSTMVAASEETSSQSKMVLGNAAQASTSISDVNRAVQELSLAIQDISRNTTETGNLVNTTVQVANGAMTVTREMETAGQRVFQVIEIIQGLAAQTNLLALNASIEAARAGEAGRGFAVVADEVKKLASSTAASTEEITQHVRGMQEVTGKTVEAIQNVSDSITRISDATHAVMSAVQEQSSVAEEITHSLDKATDSVRSAESNMGGIVEAANDTAEASNRVADNVKSIDGAFVKMDQSLHTAFQEIGVKA